MVTDANRRLRDWRQAVTFALQAWQGGVLEGPLELRLSFVLTRPKSAPKSAYWVAKRPDLVKLARAVEDACRGVVMRDDAQVASLRAEKRYALPGEPTGVVIEAVPLQSPARASHSRSRVRSSRQRRQP
ncbi:MAG: RusA family crossover junction endodeoxyribonuclease [Candidatus Nitrosotenuis sp.]